MWYNLAIVHENFLHLRTRLLNGVLEMKSHIDCDWLLEIEDGVYHCCDSRSLHSGKELNEDQVMQEACEFFHPKHGKDAGKRCKSLDLSATAISETAVLAD